MRSLITTSEVTDRVYDLGSVDVEVQGSFYNLPVLRYPIISS